MAAWEDELAFRHAPVILQKLHPVSPRSDYLTRVDFASDWNGVWNNWDAVFAPASGGQPIPLTACVYYSVVETPSHAFLLYALYHPQDWQALWGAPTQRPPDLVDEHRHDMEGCLAVVPRNPGDTDAESCAALVTVAHYHLEKYAGWRLQDGTRAGTPCWLKPQWHDRPVLESTRFAGGPGEGGDPPEPRRRFKIYVDACGHAVRGSARDWGSEDHVIRYRPSLTTAEEPKPTGFEADPGDPARIQTVRYRLINMFDQAGLWPQRDNPRVFQLTDGQTRAAFAVRKASGAFAPGSANPPWAWQDDGVALPPGAMATDPARLTAYYFYCKAPILDRAYLHNPYQGIVKAVPAPARAPRRTRARRPSARRPGTRQATRTPR